MAGYASLPLVRGIGNLQVGLRQFKLQTLATVVVSPIFALAALAMLICLHPSPVSAAEAATPAKEAHDTHLPSMSIVSPTNGQVVPFLNPCYVHGTALAPDGVVTQVMYFVNGKRIGTGGGQNWLLGWWATNLGPYVLIARVTDNRGVSSDSAPIHVEVRPFPPRLVLIDPACSQETIEPLDGAILRAGSTNRFHADLEVYFPLRSIDLLVDGVKANDPRTFPYLVWIPTNLGLHRLQAVVDDQAGARLTSGPVTVRIANVRPPSLAIRSPTNNSSFPRGAVITIQALATDQDGQITNLTISAPGRQWSLAYSTMIEGAVSNLSGGWHRVEAAAINDSAQMARESVQFFVPYEENPALRPPDGFAVEADDSDNVTLKWNIPKSRNRGDWLTVEQKQADGEWIEIRGCPIEDGEFIASQLQAETSYDFRIAFLARNRQRSPYSPVIRATTLPWEFPTKR